MKSGYLYMSSYHMTDSEIYDFIVTKYPKASNKVVNCVITHYNITKNHASYRTKQDLYDTLHGYVFQYMDII